MIWNRASNKSVGLARAQLYVVCAGAFALPLVVLWSTNDPVILPKLLAARALIVILAALLIARWARGELTIRRTPLDLPVVAFVASAGVSTLFAANPNLAFLGAYGRMEGFLTIATYAALFWLTVQSVAGPAQARSVISALLAGAFVVSLLATGQAVATTLTTAPSGESAATFDGVARAVGTFGNANALAAYLAMVLPIAVYEYLRVKEFQDRLLAGNVVAVTTIALVLTFGRGAWIGALVGVAVVLAISRPSLRRVASVAAGAVVAIALIAAVVAVLGAGGPQIAQSASARLVSLADPTGGSGAARLHVWKDTLGMIASRPVTGYGPDNFGLVFPRFQTGPWAGSQSIDEAHSELLQVGATQGLIGIAALGWLCFAFVRMCWNRRGQVGSGAVLGAGAAYLITILVNFSVVPAALPFWLFLGAATVFLEAGDLPEADEHLGLQAEAIAAAQRSVELGRFDPRNRAVLEAVSTEQGAPAAGAPLLS